MSATKPKILVVDDSRLSRETLRGALEERGYHDVEVAGSAKEAFEKLGIGMGVKRQAEDGFDLVLLDFIMPDMDGMRACKLIKTVEHLKDVPVIVITGRTDSQSLKAAFDAGAMDFLHKPLNMVELAARVKSALTLKAEIDRRRGRERELMDMTRRLSAANRELRRISSLDGLTGLANRRFFDKALDSEWRRARRMGHSLAVMMIDIDHFKKYNDHYGHLAGDDCLKKVAGVLEAGLQRAGDMVARYGGEEFVALMPATDTAQALELAQEMGRRVEEEAISHQASPVAPVITVSLGVAAVVPQADGAPAQLVEAADQALYRSKEAGRNQATAAPA